MFRSKFDFCQYHGFTTIRFSDIIISMARDYVNAPKTGTFMRCPSPKPRARVESKESSITVTVFQFNDEILVRIIFPVKGKTKSSQSKFCQETRLPLSIFIFVFSLQVPQKTRCSRFQDVVRHQHGAVGCQGCFMEKNLDIFQKTRATLIEEDHVKMTRKTG